MWRHQLRLALREQDRDPEAAKARERLLLEALRDLADRLPGEPALEVLLANLYSFRREYPEAVRAFERAEALAKETEDPSLVLNEEFRFDYAAALERIGRIEEAVERFNALLTTNPDHHRALNYLAYMWAERDENLEQALEYVRKALRLDPGNGSYLDTLGWVHYRLGDFEKAYAELREAAEAIPDESVVAEHLGDVLMKLDRPVEAVGYYRIALELEPRERREIVEASLEKAEAAVVESLSVSAEAP